MWYDLQMHKKIPTNEATGCTGIYIYIFWARSSRGLISENINRIFSLSSLYHILSPSLLVISPFQLVNPRHSQGSQSFVPFFTSKPWHRYSTPQVRRITLKHGPNAVNEHSHAQMTIYLNMHTHHVLDITGCMPQLSDSSGWGFLWAMWFWYANIATRNPNIS